ncbi:hypothetical protein CMI37_32170 [Candidatus Pacearchaeota archaeon]|nr:hypothetical protein [Candidatus Pacearchaeota archaeon]|tara:strand:- start:1297 stop:1515 length:219 start_codon:yes stop_codon:yes gene_type:complete
MSHERTITIDDKFFNIKTIVKGKHVGKREAVDHAIKTKTLGSGFTTQTEAVNAAKERSESFNRPANPSRKRR